MPSPHFTKTVLLCTTIIEIVLLILACSILD
jgi:hypothetical protein